jgi:branched-chain amino acid transport system ATP-binding protein
MLKVEGLRAGYGGQPALFGVDLEVGAGQTLALIGRNGMGKTTTVSAIFGLVTPTGGRIAFDGVELVGKPSHEIARLGLGLVPEGRRVFPTLTVEENLVATRRPDGPWTLTKIYELLPRLAEDRYRLSNRLSGGEQQMVAIGRALMTNPRMLVLDEATEGLAPRIRAEIWACLERLKRDGLSTLVIDKNLASLLRLADRLAILEKGRVVWTGSPADFRARPETAERFLHLGATS